MSRKNECLVAVLAELEAVGVGYDIRRARHIKVFITLGGKVKAIIVPVTPSDHRASKSARSFVRRILREAGFNQQGTG